MGNTIQFDLNTAIRNWQDRLKRSPQFQDENLVELESHLRDSVARLQEAQLSEEEAFMVATHRIGSLEQLETEFAKINRNPMNKLIHGLILLFFSAGCWFLVALLVASEHLTRTVMANQPLPAFTVFCQGLRPVIFYVLPALALIWCVIVWVRKTENRNSWQGFFAITASVIMLASFPIIIAVFIPMVRAIEIAATK